MNSDFRRLLTLLTLTCLPAIAHAQTAPADRVSQETSDRVLQGRSQYDNNDARSVATLRDAAQSSLVALNQVSGQNVLVSQPQSLPVDVVTTGLAQKAAEAHYYWGLAADRFAFRDEAITALTRAMRILRAISGPNTDGGTLRRDTSLELGRVLRDGLPLIAPDDALDSIASIAHGGLWTPLRYGFDPSPLVSDIGAPALPKSEFMVTDGKLFPPVGPDNQLARIPPYYQGVPEISLPPSLKLDKMIAGYVRETSGTNKGQWRQVARVFYASHYLTKDRRDDMPRARDLCEQFLKVQALYRQQLGATNLYAKGNKIEGVTTLWLLEVSALWPQDDDDPAILAQLGPLMPNLNVGPRHEATDPEVTALSRPWMPIAGQSESSPGEIMFWKAGMTRPEGEWVRELFHEYGHVALPPLGGFRPPLEPFANGMMGETLGMLWAAQTPDRFNAVGADIVTHVSTQALPSLRFFIAAGPGSSLRASGTIDGLHYLQGLTTYLERVYGGDLLGRALAPLSTRAAGITSVAERRSLMGTQTLMNSLDISWKDPWNGAKTMPIWLPGAFATTGTAANLISRGDGLIKAGTTTKVLLYVPNGANSLRIEGAGATGLRSVGLPFSASAGGVRLYFAGKTGWQTFSLTTEADAKISAARFEKK